jgi:hypothetical protein
MLDNLSLFSSELVCEEGSETHSHRQTLVLALLSCRSLWWPSWLFLAGDATCKRNARPQHRCSQISHLLVKIKRSAMDLHMYECCKLAAIELASGRVPYYS